MSCSYPPLCRVLLFILTFAPIAFSQVSFLPVVTYQSEANGGWAVVSVDLNSDGVLDLAVTEGSALIGVLLGNGDGTFKSPVSYSTNGIIPTDIVAADVNSDGKPDVIVSGIVFGSSTNAGAVAVFLGKGDGSFQSPVIYDSGGPYTYSLATADFNSDGKLDIVVADCSPVTGSSCGLFGILLGNGDGTFQPVVTHDSGGVGAWALTVADLNADHKPDLVIADLCTSSFCPDSSDGVVAVLLGNGDGTFKSPVTYDSLGRPLVPAVADVNGDGKPDILVANGQGGRGLAVLLGNGDGTFQAAVTYNVGKKFASSLAIADFNNDGKPDVAVSDCGSGQFTCETIGSVSVLLGKGDGTFKRPAIFNSGGQTSVGVAVGDFNRDGWVDIAVANCGISACNGTQVGVTGVLLNNTGVATKTSLTSSLNPSVEGQAVVFTAAVTSNSGPPPNGEVVTFYNGSSKLGTGMLNAGFATLLISTLPPGTSSITATYPGDSSLVASTSTVLRQVVNPTSKLPTVTTLASSLTPSVYGQAVSLIASVTNRGGPTPTGKINFSWSGGSIGTAMLNANGAATLTRSNLNAGTFPIVATYLGDGSNLNSQSAILSQVVSPATSKATITSAPNPSSAGQAVTFTAKITSPTVTPTGPVTFTAGNTILGTVQLNKGTATLTTSSLPIGSTVVKVKYSGNSNIKGSSASITEVVQ